MWLLRSIHILLCPVAMPVLTPLRSEAKRALMAIFELRVRRRGALRTGQEHVHYSQRATTWTEPRSINTYTHTHTRVAMIILEFVWALSFHKYSMAPTSSPPCFLFAVGYCLLSYFCFLHCYISSFELCLIDSVSRDWVNGPVQICHTFSKLDTVACVNT
jgi:hypothetical protein